MAKPVTNSPVTFNERLTFIHISPVDFSPQSFYRGSHGFIGRLLVGGPDPGQQGFGAKKLLRMPHKKFKQRHLNGREMDLLATLGESAVFCIQLHITAFQYIINKDRRSAHNRLKPDEKLFQTERLGKVVVGTNVKAGLFI